MLLTLAVKDARTLLDGEARANQTLLDVPDFAIRHLGLRGLNIFSSALSGWSVEDLDTMRDRADKAGCPCLVLVEDDPLPFASSKARDREKAVDRLRRLAAAAHRLGCSAIAVQCAGEDSDDAFEQAATTLREAMPAVERLELNLLLEPVEGLTSDPDRLTDLIKRIGGFRIGSMPTFAHSAEVGGGDPIASLRKIAPYAGAIHASVSDFTKTGKHKAGYDLGECVHAVRAVGFGGTLAIEYIGSGDAVAAIEAARTSLQEAIEAEE